MHRFSGILLVDAQGRLLLQERDEHPVIAPDQWALVGGHVEDGEDFETAAYRELEEETGIGLAPGTLRLWRELPLVHAAYGTQDLMQVYVAPTTLVDADIVLGEGRQIVFVAPDDARRLDLAMSAAIIVPDFLDSELYRSLVDPA